MRNHSNSVRRSRARAPTLALTLALGLAPMAAQAAAPEPRRPVEVSRFLGRWFEIAHTPNAREKPCVAATMEFIEVRPERYAVVQTCRKADPRTPVQMVRAGVTFTDRVGHTKLDVAFFGGLIRAHYWVLDHAPDYSWAVVSTSGGRYVWLLAHEPKLPAAEMQAAEASLRSLGFEPAALAYPKG